jgi:hypothetical protein
MCREQQTCLGTRNSLDKPDALERLIESLQTFNSEFDNDIPAAVGGVQRLHLRDIAQRFEHRGRMFSVDRHHGDSPNVLWCGVRPQAHGKTTDCAVSGQAVDAILYRTTRDFEAAGQSRHWPPCILAKKRDQPPIGVVHLS